MVIVLDRDESNRLGRLILDKLSGRFPSSGSDERFRCAFESGLRSALRSSLSGSGVGMSTKQSVSVSKKELVKRRLYSLLELGRDSDKKSGMKKSGMKPGGSVSKPGKPALKRKTSFLSTSTLGKLVRLGKSVTKPITKPVTKPVTKTSVKTVTKKTGGVRKRK